MGAKSKRAKSVRIDKEFDLKRLSNMLKMPRDGRNIIDQWSADEIQAARAEQMLGQFIRPSRMSESMNTDDAIFTAKSNRLAPLSCIPVDVLPAAGARGASIAAEAEALFGPNGVGIAEGTLKNIHECLVDHGVAFANVATTPRPDGSRVDFELHYWPIEYIWWDATFRVFKARCDPTSVQPGDIPDSPNNDYGFTGGFWLPVIHGDGRWVIFSDWEIDPFRRGTILPAAVLWSRHAFANRDWSRGSRSHGSAKVIGELPAGMPLQSAEGVLTAEAAAFIELLREIGTSDSPAGIRPAGSKTEFVTNNSSAWQVWSTLSESAEKGAARIYLGTDGTLGSQGGAPGVDVQSLFGVADTKVTADCRTISRGINSGVIAPWCAVNFGTSALAPERRYRLPNKEKEAVRSDYSARNDAYYKALVDAKQAGLVLTPAYIAELADDYGVRVPGLASPPTAAPAPAVK